MTKSLMLLSIIVLSLLAGTASAQSISYGNGWKKECFDDGKCAYSNHPTYLRWDNQWIPAEWLNISNGNWSYIVVDAGTNMNFTADGKTISIPKANTNFNLELFKISPSLTYSKTALINNMVNVNATVAYLVFPYSLSQIKDYVDEYNIKVGRWLFHAGQEHIDIYDDVIVNHTFVNESGQNETYLAVTTLNKSFYQFRIVNGEIRLYFLKAEANKLSGNITFALNSWTVGEGGSMWAGNSTLWRLWEDNDGLIKISGNISTGTWTKSYEGSQERIYSLAVYNGSLYAGQGSGGGDGDIFVFNGASWTKSYEGSQEQIYSLAVYDGKLYAGQGSGIGDGDIFVFNGTSWTKSFEGAQEKILSLAAYDGKLYAGQGSTTGDGDVWVFNGTSWSISYNGVQEEIFALAAYNGNLYAGQGSSLVDGDVFVFNGTSWSTSYDGTQEEIYSLGVYNGKLYAGQGYETGDGDALVFDGTSWSISYNGVQEEILSFAAYNGNLYAGEGYGAGDGDVLVFNGTSWNTSYNGAQEYILALAVYNGNLYAGQGYGSGDGDVFVFNQSLYSGGNLTTWHNSGSGNETYQIDVNTTTVTNTNYTVWYANNGTGSWTQLGGTLTGNNSLTIAGTKYQNTDVQVRLAGNTTSTPELITVTFWTQTASAGDTTPPTYSGVAHNQTIAGLPTLFSIQFNDDTALHPNGQWIFSTNNTGEWVNESAVNWTATPEWANVTKTLNSTVETVVGYRWYASDNAGNLNDTTIYTVTVTSGAILYERIAADSIATTEGASRTLYSFRAASDSLVITEVAQRIYYGFRSTSDAITVTEYASATFIDVGEVFTKYVSEAITLVDGAARQLTYVRLTSDSISVTEGAQRIYYGFRSISDTITVIEYATATFTDVGEIFTRYTSDAITVVEGATRRLTYVRFTSDSISVTEGAQRLLSAFRNVSDAVTITDSASRKLSAFRQISDAITVVDSAGTSVFHLFIRYASEVITVTDSAISSFWAGVNFIVSGYVNNALGCFVKDARVEYVGGNYTFTDASGYYNISVPSGTRDILSRAIGYRNNTETVIVSGDIEQNFTMKERTPGTVSMPGFSAISGIFIIVVTLILVRTKKRSD